MAPWHVETLKTELMLSTSQAVYEWLKERDRRDIEKTNRINNGSRESVINWEYDRSIDELLFQRNDLLVNHGLACFGINLDVAKKQFNHHSDKRTVLLDSGYTLRLAILANQTLAKTCYNFICSLFDDDFHSCLRWLNAASHNEIYAIFQNPYIGDNFLCDFLTNTAPWSMVSKNKKILAIQALADNSRIYKEYEGLIYDGHGEYCHYRLFDICWQLAETAPVNTDWARCMHLLYYNLKLSSYSLKEPLRAAKRWLPNKNETPLNYRFLDDYGIIRKKLGCLAITGDRDKAQDLFFNEDIALRCAAYSSGSLSSEQIVMAYEKDKTLSLHEMLDNDEIWRKESLREALEKMFWRAIREDNEDCLLADSFHSRKDYKFRLHPSWFQNKAEQTISKREKSIISELKEEVAALHNQFMKFQQNIKFVFWVMLAVGLIRMVFR